MMVISTKNKKLALFLLPTLLLCLYVLKSAYGSPLHDFSNSYFSARLLHDGIAPETILFDIYAFNSYIWELGYTRELVDFYINSPFTLAVFYPLAYIQDAQMAKLIFNSIGMFSLLLSLAILGQTYLKKQLWLLLLVPILFYVPIRNGILFGQSYFVILLLVVLAFSFFEKQKNVLGSSLLSVAVGLKFFPIFYGLPLVFQKRWSALLWTSIIGLLLIVGAISITGSDIWKQYIFEILPHTLQSNTTTDYRFTYQSLSVFFKTLFVEDPYYNPSVWIASKPLYILANWVTKALILGSAFYASIKFKKDLFVVLAIWVTTLFVTQSRTATYAQLLWIIPLVAVYKLQLKRSITIVCVLLIALICNAPFHKLGGMPVVLQFSRVWLVMILIVLMYWSSVGTFSLRYVLIAFVLLLPLHKDLFMTKVDDKSEYVLDQKAHFMIYDFQTVDGKLSYSALGKGGDETIHTDIEVSSFDEDAVVVKDHQLFMNGIQLTQNISLKKKPILVNNCEVYFLTDHHSRRAVFTLKKIDICGLEKSPL